LHRNPRPMPIREGDRQPRAAMPAIPRHHRYSLTSQRMPRIGDFYFCWKPAGMVLQCVTDFNGQLDLERHGGRATQGRYARISQRLPAMATAIWHNRVTAESVNRSLIGSQHHRLPLTGGTSFLPVSDGEVVRAPVRQGSDDPGRRSGQDSTRGPASASRGSRLRGARVWSRCSASASSPLVLGHSTVPRGRAPRTKVPGLRDFRPGRSAVCCRMSLSVGGCAGRRAVASRGERARPRAGRGWPPGVPQPGKARAFPPCYWAASSDAIRTWLHVLPR
jgi:hypothetical protein